MLAMRKKKLCWNLIGRSFVHGDSGKGKEEEEEGEDEKESLLVEERKDAILGDNPVSRLMRA